VLDGEPVSAAAAADVDATEVIELAVGGAGLMIVLLIERLATVAGLGDAA